MPLKPFFVAPATACSLLFSSVASAQDGAPATKNETIDVGALAVLPFLAKYGATGTPAPGIEMVFHYEWSRVSVGVGVLVAGNSAGDNGGSSVGFVALSLGVRYLLTDTDVAPFVGSGLALSYEQVTSNHWAEFGAKNQGVGAFAEIGVTMFRTHECHLSVALRADLPFYELPENDGPPPTGVYAPGGAESPSPLYAVPISLAATFTF